MRAEAHVKNRRFVLALSAAVLVWGGAAWAAEPNFPVSIAPGQQTRGVHLGAPEMRLSLQDAIAVALQHNINLEVSRLGLASAEQSFLSSTGIFDPLLQGTTGANYSESPATNELVGAQVALQRGRTFDLSLGKLMPTGGSVSLGWTNSRSKTNSTFFFLNPAYQSGLTFSLSQPLLQGFGTDVTRATIEVARRSRDISRVQFEEIVISTAQAVQSAYWNLVYAIDDLKVKQHSLKLAQDLLDQTRTRVRIGTSAPIDIVQSEAAVAARELDIIVAENAVENAADVLKDLMGFENPDDWTSKIVPTDALEATAESVDLDKSIETALQRRPELQQRRLEEEIGEVNLLVAKNALRPQLNLGLNYGFAGVGGDQLVLDPQTGQVISTIAGGWDNALSQLVNRDYNQWSAGITFSYPLGNTGAKAQLAERRFNLSSARQSTALTRQAIISDVRNAVRGLDASAKAITAAVKSRELAERNLDAEQKKFANGMSTNFQVVKIQDDLAIAQAAELQARVLYRQAATVYRAAVGGLLEAMGIAINEEAQPKEPHTGWKNVSWLRFGHFVKGETGTPEGPK
jgi:outer membrane protein